MSMHNQSQLNLRFNGTNENLFSTFIRERLLKSGYFKFIKCNGTLFKER